MHFSLPQIPQRRQFAAVQILVVLVFQPVAVRVRPQAAALAAAPLLLERRSERQDSQLANVVKRLFEEPIGLLDGYAGFARLGLTNRIEPAANDVLSEERAKLVAAAPGYDCAPWAREVEAGHPS